MKFIADLHIHSRFSRATSKELNFESLYTAARLKGITVLGTGDFTHPAWFSEIQEMLVPAESDLLKLRDEVERACEQRLRLKKPAPVRFMLSCEISNIYKKAGKTRKTHNLVFLPDTQSAARFNARLDRIGNIKSDGRPILGLDSRDLLEIVLETSDEGFLIPAHIWTPWFSMFGSKSGFDSMQECFEDLTPHLFALETGLSSDPPMNWRVGDIDGLTLVSNSDAHSPSNLGREANLFDTELSYPEIKAALKTGDPKRFCGTLEFYPQEGKYHQDGHRKCGVNLTPKEAKGLNGICPVCGQPMTEGVLHRVEDLATRPEGESPSKIHPYYSIIPLAEIIGEIIHTGSSSKKAHELYTSAVHTLGPELEILHAMPLEAVRHPGLPLLPEAIKRMREGRVHISPGYDGEYGRITLFSPDEIDSLSGQRTLFYMPEPKPRPEKRKTKIDLRSETDEKKSKHSLPPQGRAESTPNKTAKDFSNILDGLNEDQRRAVTHENGPILIVAGPGTGKTLTLTCRIAYLMKNKGVSPRNILGVTFTQKAALEMKERLSRMLGEKAELPQTATFHAFCFDLLKQIEPNKRHAVIDEYDRSSLILEAVRLLKNEGKAAKLNPEAVLDRIVSAKQRILSWEDDLTPVCKGMDVEILRRVYRSYQQILEARRLYDYEDLILKAVKVLETDPAVQNQCRARYSHVLIDEYQDLNHGQYRLVKAMTGPGSNLFAIGDPDQSIYGFRGSDVSYFQRFSADFENAVQITLSRNYRSAETLLSASCQVLGRHSLKSGSAHVHSGIIGSAHISLFEAETEKAEAVQIGKTIEEMVGGTGFDFDDFDKNPNALHGSYRSFCDFAVLYRTRSQGRLMAEVFENAGIPYQTASKENLFCQRGILELLSLFKIIRGFGTCLDFERIHAVIPEIPEPKAAWGYLSGSFLDRRMESAAGDFPASMSGPQRQRLDEAIRRFSGYAQKIQECTVREGLIYLCEQPEMQKTIEAKAKTREALDRILEIAKPFNRDAEGFLEAAALYGDPDVFEANSQKVALLTMHAAKGLEFPVVFIAGCENGLIPFFREKGEPFDIDEERRLFYVAMTRAKEHLFLTRANRRILYGKTEKRQASPFIADIEEKLLKQEKKPPPQKPVQVQMKLFS